MKTKKFNGTAGHLHEGKGQGMTSNFNSPYVTRDMHTGNPVLGAGFTCTQ